MSDSYNTRIKLKRDTEANWTSKNPVLLDGEMVIVKTTDGKTRKKIGDGTKKFSELPYDEITVDGILSNTSTNPIQNKAVKSALDSKAGTAVATQSANGLMSKSDKVKLDGITTGANKIIVDSLLTRTSTNPVQNKVITEALDAAKAVATTAANGLMSAIDKSKLDQIENMANRVEVDLEMSSSSLNPVSNTVICAALDGKANANHTHSDYYTKTETDNAIAVRASTSAYGTTKLSNSTTSSSKTTAATPYAVRSALSQAKKYVDSSIAVAINSSY